VSLSSDQDSTAQLFQGRAAVIAAKDPLALIVDALGRKSCVGTAGETIFLQNAADQQSGARPMVLVRGDKELT